MTGRDSRVYSFRAPLEELHYGRMTYWVVYLPEKLERKSPFSDNARLRVEGTLGEQTVNLALLAMRGRHYLLVSRALARKAGATIGTTVPVAFTIASAAAVRLPPELMEALRQEPGWAAAWERLSTGAKRGVAHRVGSAKRSDTRARRAIEALRALSSFSPATSDGATDEDEGLSFFDPDLADEKETNETPS